MGQQVNTVRGEEKLETIGTSENLAIGDKG